jgi:hypothetical protein
MEIYRSPVDANFSENDLLLVSIDSRSCEKVVELSDCKVVTCVDTLSSFPAKSFEDSSIEERKVFSSDVTKSFNCDISDFAVTSSLENSLKIQFTVNSKYTFLLVAIATKFASF